MHIPFGGQASASSRRYHHWQMLTAADVMKPQVLTVQLDWNVEHLSCFLSENHISGAPVVDEFGLLCGMVSSIDIMNCLGGANRGKSGRMRFCERTRYNHDNPYAVHSRLLAGDSCAVNDSGEQMALVVDIMTPVILSVEPDMPLVKVAEAMLKADISRVLVTRERQLMGIISLSDVLSLVLNHTTR